MLLKKYRYYTITAYFLILMTFVCAILIGVVVGMHAAISLNTARWGDVGRTELSIPTRVYAENGEQITEFFGSERRELIAYEDVPRGTILSLLSREDRGFYEHPGFSIQSLSRAMLNISRKYLTPGTGYFSGGSTITQQLSGHLYANRSNQTISRKVRELWWAMQLERHLTKQEMLETYMNKMPFGHSTYGIQAASNYYFGHDIQQSSIAESVMIVIQLSSPVGGKYSPIRNPQAARHIQSEILRQMGVYGILTPEQAVQEEEIFWQEHDWSRDGFSTAFFEREDKAPYFSEYVRTELDELIGGRHNIYTDGFSVYTTLNLRHQAIAEEELEAGFKFVNGRLQEARMPRYTAIAPFSTTVELLALNFNLPALRPKTGRPLLVLTNYLASDINHTLDAVTAIFGTVQANNVAKRIYSIEHRRAAAGRVEAALITVESDTGHITALVGGSGFRRSNQLNRAMDGKIMPGSAFKPLYYAEAIASTLLTAASNLDNHPKAWTNPDGTLYIPNNYNKEFSQDGTLLRNALALSLNIPAITLLETIGIDAAIARSSRLLGIRDPEVISRTFPRGWALGLGVISIAPVQMVRAFATFPNGGKEVIPIGIRRIYDRDGRVFRDIEAETKIKQERSDDREIMSPQAAYVMTDIMTTSVRNGTLYWAHQNNARPLDQPLAGKTGTTQNWGDAWAIVFTPYYTSAVWYGFDRGGNTLGIRNEASSSAAPVMMRYLRRIHEGLPRREFVRPAGLINALVCSVSGQLYTSGCREAGHASVNEIFILGTVPTQSCQMHDELERSRQDSMAGNVAGSIYDQTSDLFNFNNNSSSGLFLWNDEPTQTPDFDIIIIEIEEEPETNNDDEVVYNEDAIAETDSIPASTPTVPTPTPSIPAPALPEDSNPLFSTIF